MEDDEGFKPLNIQDLKAKQNKTKKQCFRFSHILFLELQDSSFWDIQ